MVYILEDYLFIPRMLTKNSKNTKSALINRTAPQGNS